MRNKKENHDKLQNKKCGRRLFFFNTYNFFSSIINGNFDELYQLINFNTLKLGY